MVAEVPAARQALQILAHLARQAGPVPAAVIVRDLRLPRSTVYHLLATMAELGFVTHLPDDRRWSLGVAAYELGSGYSRQAPLQRIARVPLAELVDRTSATAHLAVLHGAEVLYVIEERVPGRPPLVTDVDVRLPAAVTASGRAILAALPAAAVRALFPGPESFAVRTGSGPRSLTALRSLLVDVRRHGHAVEVGEVSEGFGSVAAAVLDHAGHPVAAVAVTVPTDDADGATAHALLDHYAAPVRRTASMISQRIGGIYRASDKIR